MNKKQAFAKARKKLSTARGNRTIIPQHSLTLPELNKFASEFNGKYHYGYHMMGKGL